MGWRGRTAGRLLHKVRTNIFSSHCGRCFLLQSSIYCVYFTSYTVFNVVCTALTLEACHEFLNGSRNERLSSLRPSLPRSEHLHKPLQMAEPQSFIFKHSRTWLARAFFKRLTPNQLSVRMSKPVRRRRSESSTQSALRPCRLPRSLLPQRLEHCLMTRSRTRDPASLPRALWILINLPPQPA